MSGAERREQLLGVTAEIVAEAGFSAITIEAVARAAGISRPIVYEHFGDLAGLLEAVVEREMARALEQVTGTELRDLSKGPPRELMIESLAVYLRTVRENPTTWRLVLMAPDGAPAALREGIRDGRAAVLGRLSRSLLPALSAHEDGPDAELTAEVLSAISDAYARLVLTDPERFPPERLLVHARWCVDQVQL